MARDATISKIHIAKKEFNLDDDAVRDVYERVTKKRSLKDMTAKQRLAVLDDFKSRGFKVTRSAKATSNSRNFSSKKYVRLIFALWASCTKLGEIKDGSHVALRSFVATQTEKRGTRIDDPAFLTYDQASPVIETLKSMEKRGKAKR
jgi:phage gp16-like protein